MSNKPLVVFSPNWSKNNPYQNMLAESLAATYKVVMEDLPNGLFPFSSLYKIQPNMKILHLHWLTELVHRVSWSKSSSVFYLKLSLLCIDLIRLKKRGVTIVWTIHNKVSHQKLNMERELLVRRMFCKLADKVIVHSEEARTFISDFYNYPLNNKGHVIFHGNYQNAYPLPSDKKNELRLKCNFAEQETILLYFGSIRPYKGVDTLISSFRSIAKNENLRLVLAGNVIDDNYKHELLSAINNDAKIHAHFNFIPEAELIDLIELADLVVIPFADTLTSGSTILAMTQGKALILPERAKIFGCVPNEGVRYFVDPLELTQLLAMAPSLPFLQMGAINKSTAENMSWEKVGKLTGSCYAESR